MALNRLKQVLIREQVDPSNFLTPLSATYGKFYAIDPTCTREVSRYERNLARDSITMPHALSGTRRGRLTFSLEMTGQAAGTPDLPAWDIAMRACGMKSVATSRCSIGAITSGPFRHGETITFSGTGSGTATVLHDTYSGSAHLYFWNISSGASTPSGVTITGSSSGASATSSSTVADVGQSWYPVSKHTSQFTYSSMTGTVTAGMVVKGNTSLARAIVVSIDTTAKLVTFRYYSGAFSTSETVSDASGASNSVSSISAIGQADVPAVSAAIIEDGHVDVLYAARGNFKLNAKIGEPVVMQFELYGPLVSPATVADQALITSIAYDSKIPPLFLGTSMKLGHEGDTNTSSDYTPRITSFALDMGNELYVRENASVADGYEDCVITGRNCSGSFDPELDLETSYSFFQDFTGVSSVPLGRTNFTVGSSAGNSFYVSLPGMQYDPAQTQSRNGVLAYQIPFKATGGYLSTESAATIGSDNEFCITYLLV